MFGIRMNLDLTYWKIGIDRKGLELMKMPKENIDISMFAPCGMNCKVIKESLSIAANVKSKTVSKKKL